MTHTKYLSQYLIPLFDGTICEFSVDWCHARMVAVDAVSSELSGVARTGADEEIEGEDGIEDEDEDDEPTGYLEVSFLGALPTEAHRSVDSALLARPHLLRILSMLTYFCRYIYDVSSPVRSSHQYQHPNADSELALPPKLATRLIIEDVDRSAELQSLLDGLDVRDKGGFMASLLDRWRKGLFLRTTLGETVADEAALCFFHILEAIGLHYKEDAIAEAKGLMEPLTTQLVDRILLHRGSQRDQTIAQINKEIIATVTAEENFGIRTLIAFAFSQLGLLSEKTLALIGRLVNFRNDVAHARSGAAIRRSTWPLPAFFYQTKPGENEVVEILEILSARTIAAFAKIPTWTDEWAHAESSLHPSDDLIQKFVNDDQQPSPEAFERGDVLGVRPSSVVNFWLPKKNKLKLPWLEKALGVYVTQISPQSARVEEYLMAAILLADSKNVDLAAAARTKVLEAFSNLGLELRHPSDIFKEFLVHEVEPAWFRSWARQGRPKDEQ